MPTLSVAVSHTLGQEQAIQRLKEQFASIKGRFGEHVSDSAEEWDGNVLRYRFTALGIQVQGTVTSEDSEVKVTASLPLVAMPFKGRIEQQIRDELEKILA